MRLDQRFHNPLAGLRLAPLLVLFLVLALISFPAPSAETPAATPVQSASVINKASLEKKIQAIEADTSLPEKERLQLVAIYRKAISNLETALSNEQSADDFIQMKQQSPATAIALRKKTASARHRSVDESLNVTESMSIEELEQRLLKEQADLASMEAKLQKTQESIKYLADRPEVIRKQLVEAKKMASDIAEGLKPPASSDQGLTLEDAEYALKYSKAQKLASQIRMLDLELLSLPERNELLKAQEENEEQGVDFVRARVEKLENMIAARRQLQAHLTESKAESAQALAEGKHPLVKQLADSNAELSTQISELTSRLNLVKKERDRVSAEEQRITEEFNSTRKKLEVAGLSQILGQILQEQRRLLPDTKSYARKTRDIEQEIAEISLRQIQHNDELKALRQLDVYLANYTSGISSDTFQRIKPELRALAKDRRQFLEQAYKTEGAYLRTLSELDIAQHNLSDITEQYDTYLSEHLLWIRSIAPISLSSLARLPAQFFDLLTPEHWRDVGNTIYRQATGKPWLLLTLLVVIVLLWKEKALRRRLVTTGDNVGNVMRDNILSTVLALEISLLLATAWPLLMASVGWQLTASLDSTAFTKTVGQGLILAARFLFILRFYRILCMKGGVAERHFKWPQLSVRLLRRAIDIFIYTFIPAGLVAYLVIFSGIPGHDEGLGRIAFIIAALALTMFFYRVLNPTTGVLREFSKRQNRPAITGMRYLWLIIAVVIPISSAILALLGYLYSAGKLLENLVQSLWLILALVLLHQFVVRWLLIVRRRLALQAAREQRAATLAARESAATPDGEDTPEIEEPKIDIAALSDDIRKLLNTSLATLAAIVLWVSWSDILPALHIFDKVTLWQHKVDINGELKVMPVTLEDVGIAIIVTTILLIMLKRLPALIEILLRQQSSISPGSLYAIKTLTRYAIIAIGTVVIFSTLGGTWSEIQWVFAALGVGIGFGLQEIVANFISGLIILFERPIRVGDIVTVGDISGTVTKIRIRATTIRDFDRKELLVPNKEFITNRLLNWSLSDTTMRISVPVGIAYGSDVELAIRLMEEAARESEYTIDDPAPYVIFDAFGDDALIMILRCFIDKIDYRRTSRSELHRAINKKFSEAGISIAFPQRDVHLDTSRPLDIRIQRDDNPSPGEVLA